MRYRVKWNKLISKNQLIKFFSLLESSLVNHKPFDKYSKCFRKDSLFKLDDQVQMRDERKLE